MNLTDLLRELFESQEVLSAGGVKNEITGNIEVRVTKLDRTLLLVERINGAWTVGGEPVEESALIETVRKAATR